MMPQTQIPSRMGHQDPKPGGARLFFTAALCLSLLAVLVTGDVTGDVSGETPPDCSTLPAPICNCGKPGPGVRVTGRTCASTPAPSLDPIPSSDRS